MPLPVYNVGLVTVTNGSTALTFSGGAALQSTDPTSNATVYAIGEGDRLVIPGLANGEGTIFGVVDATHATLETPWQGATQSGVAYRIIKQSVSFTGTAAALAQSITNFGKDTAPAISLAVDDSTARLKARLSAGVPEIAVGAANALDAALLSGIQFDKATGVAKFPNGFKQAPGVGFRNRLHNGQFRIWQRGTSFTIGNGAGQYIADRWLLTNSFGTSIGVGQIAAPVGFRGAYALNFAAGSGASTSGAGYALIDQRMEASSGTDLDGQALMLSFDILTNLTLGVGVQILGNTAPDNGTYSVVLFSSSVSMPTGVGTVSVPIPAAYTVGFKNGVIIRVVFSNGVVSNPNVIVGSLQLEKGVVVNDFEYRPIGIELAICQRFYQTHAGIIGASAYAPVGGVTYFDVALPVVMRAIPTVSFANTSNSNCGGPSVNAAYADHVRVAYTPSATGSSYTVTDITLNAEL